jgi:hypothetical protein
MTNPEDIKMITFIRKQVRVSPEEIAQCEEYAIEKMKMRSAAGSAENYADDSQQKYTKMCEFAVARYLREVGKRVDGPDCSAHQTASFEPDLMSDIRVHVKSCNQNRRKMSAVFNRMDPVVFNPEPNDVVFYCEYSEGSDMVWIVYSVLADFLKEMNLFKDMMDSRYVKECAVYKKDIVNITNRNDGDIRRFLLSQPERKKVA